MAACEYLMHPVTVIACLASWPPKNSFTRLPETTTTCFVSDTYGMMIEACKQIIWPIYCSPAGKRPDIERKEVDVFALRGEVVHAYY